MVNATQTTLVTGNRSINNSYIVKDKRVVRLLYWSISIFSSKTIILLGQVHLSSTNINNNSHKLVPGFSMWAGDQKLFGVALDMFG